MAEQNKSPFSFPASSGASAGGLFGTPKPNTPSLFGAQTSQSATTNQPSLFGGSNVTSTTSTTPAFGGFSFGKPAASTAPTTSASTTTTMSTPSAAPSLFGSTTPANSGPKLFSNLSSTTPAATPPTLGGSKPNPFGGLAAGSSGPSGSLFGSVTPTSSSTAQPSKPAFSFAQAQPTTNNASAETPKPSLFGNAQSSTPVKPLFGAVTSAATSNTPAAAAPASNPPTFSFAKPSGTSTTTVTDANNATTSSTPVPSSGGGLFGQKAQATTESSATPSTGGLFAAKPAATNNISISSGNASGGSLFGQKPSATTSTPASGIPATPAGGLFGAASAPVTAPAATTAPTASTAPSTGLFDAQTSAPKITSGGLFGSTSSTTAATPSTSGATASSTPAIGTTTSAAPATVPASTPQPSVGNAPTQTTASRLKNKSMDEILTRWATDLAKHQKEFQKQAQQVAAWDRLLVENADQISKLVTQTFQAERDAAEVERQLSGVESQQEELEQWLDKYEKEADDLLLRAGLSNESTGTDVERERTFKMAEKLTDRLEGLNKDLSDVIDEINTVSGLLNNTKGPDDPLSNVVRVLNSHLLQLQKIDMDASALKAKVQEAQRAQVAVGNGDWRSSNDPVDDFSRSLYRR